MVLIPLPIFNALDKSRFWGFLGDQAKYARWHKEYLLEALSNVETLTNLASDVLDNCPVDNKIERGFFDWLMRVGKLIDLFKGYNIAQGLPKEWTLVEQNVRNFIDNSYYKPENYRIVGPLVPGLIQNVHRASKVKSAYIGEKSKYISENLAKPCIRDFNDHFLQNHRAEKLYISRVRTNLPNQTQMIRLLSSASQLLHDCPTDRGFPEKHFHWLFEVKKLIVDFDTSRIATEIPAAWGDVRDNITKFAEHEGYRPADYTAVVLSEICKDLVRNTDKSQEETETALLDFSSRAELFNESYKEKLEQQHTDKTLYKKKPLCKLPKDYDKSRFIDFTCRSETKNKILRSLKEHGITLIHGPGGVGKTTMLSEIAETAVQDTSMFSRVVYAKVTREASVNAIQTEIAEQLGLSWPPGIATNDGRSTELKNEIERLGKVLVILDDDWTGFDTTTIGIPSVPPVGVKVLVGTRQSDLSLGAGAANKIPVELLDDNDSWLLLQQEGKVPGRIREALAKQVQAECDGLPLALAVIGKALSGKGESHWELAVDYLRNSDPSCRHLNGVEDKLYKIIKYSYDSLPGPSDVNRRMLLSCCLFQESEEVCIVDLKRYLARDVVVKSYADNYGYGDLETIIMLAADTLEQYGLLENRITKGTVKMHDVVRDVAVYIAREESYAYIRCGRGDKRTEINEKTMSNFKRVSLSNINIEDVKPDSPKLETLLIRGNVLLPDLFFEKMVTSLAMLDLSHTDISTLPSSVANLQEVRTLLLNGCTKLSEVDVVVQLSKLNELSLRDSVVKLLPKHLVGPTVLDWEDSSLARKQDPSVTDPAVTVEHVQGLRKLIELSMASGNVTNDAFQKITEFKDLKAVKLYVTNKALSSKDSFADAEKLKWTRFTIYNHGHRPPVSQGKHLSIMDLDQVPPGVKALLQKAEEVVINHCFYKVTMPEETPVEGAKTVLVLTKATGERAFQETKILRLTECPTISFITSKDGGKLTKLVEMELTSLKELIGIFKPLECTDTDDVTIFGEVEKIAVTSCHKIKCVIPNDVLKTVDKKLQVISVKNCKMVECIFHPQADSPASLSMLTSIEIVDLEDLNCIWKGIPPQVMFNNLRDFFVIKCSKLTSLFTTHVAEQLKNLQKLTIEDNSGLTEIISAHGTPSSVQAFQSVTYPEIFPLPVIFEKLEEFNVRNCHKLTSLFSTNVAARLNSLQKFTVEDNSGLTEIVRTDGANVALSDQAFPSVMHLSLQKLPILKHFSSNEVDFRWLHLVKLNLGACPALERLPIVPDGAPRMSIIDLASSNDFTWYKNLVNQDNHLQRFQIWINNMKHVS